MRDPSIARGPDGTYHLVWTSGWWDRSIGYASTRDFVHWSKQRAIPVMEAEENAVNAWAPEIVYDDEAQHFVIYWSSTIKGRFSETSHPNGDKAPDGTPLNHRPYYTTTQDFKTFTPTTLLFNPGFNCIDPTMVKDGDGWLMIAKDETKAPRPAKFLFEARAASPTGAWRVTRRQITTGTWAEGPTILPGSTLRVIFDQYAEGSWGSLSRNSKGDWRSGMSPRMPAGARHGCIVEAGPLENSLREHLSKPE